MSKILEALDALGKQPYAREWGDPALRQFILTGEPAHLAAIPALHNSGSALEEVLPDPDGWTEEASRVLRIAVARKLPWILDRWLSRFCGSGTTRWALFDPAVKILRENGVTTTALHSLLMNSNVWEFDDGGPTPAGRLLLEAGDAALRKGLSSAGSPGEIAALLAHSVPDRLERLLETGGSAFSTLVYEAMVRVNPARFHAWVFSLCQEIEAPGDKLRLTTTLATVMPARYLSWARDEIKTALRNPVPDHDHLGGVRCGFLIESGDVEALPLTLTWIAGVTGTSAWSATHEREAVMRQAAEKAPEWVQPMAEACTHCVVGQVALLGLRYWKEHGIGETANRFSEALQRVLATDEPATVVAGIAEAKAWDLTRTQEDIWPLMLHKSRVVRSAAARALAELGPDAAGARAATLLEHKKADVRQSAVALLSHLGGAAAMAALKQRLDQEENDDVRDDILLALERNGGGAALSAGELQARIVKTLSKAKSPPAAWIDSAAMVLKRRDGSVLSQDEVLYLLIRQSRCKEMRADLEAKPLYATLDRTACGAAAHSLVQAFLGTGQDAGDRWVLAFAALIGDDRLVPVLSKAINDWADRNRGKLAEYGVQALALLGTEAALMVVDSLSVRFRSKNKNIGQAAGDAFAAAAEARGVSVEELGDLVVPWLGFEPAKPRIVTAGKTQVEVRISDDLKLVYRDTATGKSLTKLPSGAAPEAQAEFKALAATLKEAVKAQLLRIETLLVRQFRWPVARWRELYLAHPLLRPFTHRLIWCWRGDDGVIALTFRALGDGSLTDAEDSAVEVPTHGSINLVHPLDLEEPVRQAWLRHLADYTIAPPFPQLDRAVVRVKDGERATKFGKQVHGASLNAMTFRSRSEKLGWSRGSVCDGGGITAYRKHFPGAGIEAFLGLDGMYVGIGVEETITLGDVCFVNAGSVKTGSYTYDEPTKEEDARLVPFGDVPAVPFSEVMGDLARISGKSADAVKEPG